MIAAKVRRVSRLYIRSPPDLMVALRKTLGLLPHVARSGTLLSVGDIIVQVALIGQTCERERLTCCGKIRGVEAEIGQIKLRQCAMRNYVNLIE